MFPMFALVRDNSRGRVDLGGQATIIGALMPQMDRCRTASAAMAALARGGIGGKRLANPGRAVEQLAPAIGALFVERVGTVGAEGAFERADERPRRVGGKVDAAAFAIGAHGEHGGDYSRVG